MKWSIVVGNFVYRDNITLIQANEIARDLQGSVLGMRLECNADIHATEIRMGETG